MYLPKACLPLLFLLFLASPSAQAFNFDEEPWHTCQSQYASADERIEACNRLLKHHPHNQVPAHFELGSAYLEKGQPDRALPFIEKVIQEKPTYAEAYDLLGWAYQSKQHWNQALQAYQRALELQPQFVSAHYNIGEVYRKQGQWDRALPAYERALSLNPHDQDIVSRVSECKRALMSKR